MNHVLVLAVLALSSAVHGVVLTVNETGVTCDLQPKRSIMKCNNDLGVEERTYSPLVPANYFEECGNECVRRNREGNFSCASFTYRSAEFATPARRNTCVFFHCRNQQSVAQVGVTSVVMNADCFGTAVPTASPTMSPSEHPTASPTTSRPTKSPTTSKPTKSPTTSRPSRSPTHAPTKRPSKSPTAKPTKRPTLNPTTRPSKTPTIAPTKRPTNAPTLVPTTTPTPLVTRQPTEKPTSQPTFLRTNAPTTQPTPAPTGKPTAEDDEAESPTGVPTPAPTYLLHTFAPVAGGFKSPTGIHPSFPFDRSLFVDIDANAKLCMIVRPVLNTRVLSFPNFGGTKDDCMKECQYDNLCQGVLYSNVLNICSKAVMLEITDDDLKIQDYVGGKWEAYARKTAVVPYYASFCSQWASQNNCNPSFTQNQCKWNTGLRGYNQNRHTDTGYCGRTACKRAEIGFM